MAISVGDLLSGMAAGIGGTGPQFVEGLRTREAQAKQQKQAEYEFRRKAMYQDAAAGLQLLEQGDITGLIELGKDRLDMLRQFEGADPSDTMRMINLAQAAQGGNRNALAQLHAELMSATRRGTAMGLIERPAAPEVIKAGDLYQGKVVQRKADGTYEMVSPEGMPTDWLDPREKEDALTYVRQRVENTLVPNLSEMVTAYDKVMSLEGQMRSGSRSAINAAIMNTARLISPGVVTNQDAAALSGATTPIAEIANFLSGKNIDVNALIGAYDPANPETFNVDNLLNVAKSVTASGMPTIMSQIERQRGIATQYGASNQFMKSYFGDNDLLSRAMEISTPPSGINPPTEQPQTSNSVTFNSREEAMQAAERLPVGTRIYWPGGGEGIVE